MKLIKAKKLSQWLKIHRLYKSAFPDYERKPFLLIMLTSRKGRADVWEIQDNGKFSGLAVTMNVKDMVLLDYFAIAEEKRSRGIGGKALRTLQKYYSGRRFFLEIESVYTDAGNLDERLRRKRFYLKNGMTELNIMSKVFKTEMEVLGYNCKLNFDEYRSVYYHAYGERAAGNITKLDYPV